MGVDRGLLVVKIKFRPQAGKIQVCLVEILDGPLAGILSRAVVVLDGTNTVRYTEQVPEIGQEPDYTKALEAVKALLK